jgi:hypothetical protein
MRRKPQLAASCGRAVDEQACWLDVSSHTLEGHFEDGASRFKTRGAFFFHPTVSLFQE